jgi:hypothetical protein
MVAIWGNTPYQWLGLHSRKETPPVGAASGLREGRTGWKKMGHKQVELGRTESQSGLRQGLSSRPHAGAGRATRMKESWAARGKEKGEERWAKADSGRKGFEA